MINCFGKQTLISCKFSPGRVFLRNGEFSGTGFRTDAMTWTCRSWNSPCEWLILYGLVALRNCCKCRCNTSKGSFCLYFQDLHAGGTGGFEPWGDGGDREGAETEERALGVEMSTTWTISSRAKGWSLISEVTLWNVDLGFFWYISNWRIQNINLEWGQGCEIFLIRMYPEHNLAWCENYKVSFRKEVV